jgi:F-type H+-transporting ATPase subunit delta
MISKFATNYSKSLFQNAIKNKKTSFNLGTLITKNTQGISAPDVEIIGQELSLLRGIFLSSSKINSFFANPTYSEKQKEKILLSIFPGLSLTTRALLKVLTERTHLSLLPEICEEYEKFLLKFKKQTKIKLIIASPLKKEFGEKLFKALRKLSDSEKIILSVSYNPKLLGGLILEYNSMAIDASLLREFSLFFNGF